MVHFSPKTILTFIFFLAVVLVHVCCVTKQENKNLLEPGYMSLHCPRHYNPHGKLHPNAIESLKFFNGPRPFAGAAEKWRFGAENALKRDFSPRFFLTRVANQVWLVFRVDVFRAVFAKPWMALDAVVILLYLICDSKTFFLDVLLVLRIKDR